MTYVVTSPKKETLKNGRMVFPGQEIPDQEAETNPRLIERGALTLQQEAGEEEKSPPPAPDPTPSPPDPPEGEKAEQPAPEPEAPKSPPRPSRRTKAPASSVPNKEVQK